MGTRQRRSKHLRSNPIGLRRGSTLPCQYFGGRFLDESCNQDRVTSNDPNLGLVIFMGTQPRDILRNHHVIPAARLQQNELHERPPGVAPRQTNSVLG